MYVSDMIDNLSLRLEDPDKKVKDSFKLSCLENAQIFLANILPEDLLTEIQVLDIDNTVTTGVMAFSVLANDILKGVQGIKKVKNSTGLFCLPIGLHDLKKKENSLELATAQYPMWFGFANSIYTYPTSLTSIDVYHLKIPKPLRHAFTIASSSTSAKFIANASQNLSAVANVYNGAVIYVNTGTATEAKNTYHVVTGYAVTTREFTVSPVTTTPVAVPLFETTNTFYFVTHDFYLINLSAVTCELNSSFHEIIITLAEVECWKSLGNGSRAGSALQLATNMIKSVVSQRIGM